MATMSDDDDIVFVLESSPGGIVEASHKDWPENPVGPGTYPVSKDGTVTVKVTPDADKLVNMIMLDGNIMKINPNGIYKVTKITANAKFTVRFADKKKPEAEKPRDDSPKMTLVMVVVEGGEVTLNVPGNPGAKAGRAFQIKADEIFTLICTKPAKGHEFVHILGGKSVMMLPIQPVKAEGANMALKVVYEKEAGAVAHDEHHGSTWWKPWTWSVWKKSSAHHAPAAAATSSGHPTLVGKAERWAKLLAGLVLMSAIVMLSFNKTTDGYRQMHIADLEYEKTLSTNATAIALAQARATQAGASPAAVTAIGISTSCDVDPSMKSYAVFTDSKKGCVLKVTGDQHPRIKGRFRVEKLEGTPVASFSMMPCSTFRYEQGAQVNRKEGESNPFECSQVWNITEASQDATITLVSH